MRQDQDSGGGEGRSVPKRKAKGRPASSRHDPREIENCLLSIRASFKTLDTSGAKLERAVASNRTRLVGHILNEKHAQQIEQKGADALSPWLLRHLAEQRERKKPANRAAPAQPQQTGSAAARPFVGQPQSASDGPLLTQTVPEESDDDSDDSSEGHEVFRHSSEGGAGTEGQQHSGTGASMAWPIAMLDVAAVKTAEIIKPGAPSGPSVATKQMFGRGTATKIASRPSTARGRNVAEMSNAPRPSSGKSSSPKRPLSAQSTSSPPFTSMRGPNSELLESSSPEYSGPRFAHGTDCSTPRPSSAQRPVTPRVMLRVAANRPFSAPRVRWRPTVAEAEMVAEQDRSPKREHHLPPHSGSLRNRPYSAPMGGGSQVPLSKSSGSDGRRQRPRSAFCSLQPQAQTRYVRPPPREKPPLVPQCEPQARSLVSGVDVWTLGSCPH